ncbi:hypothetical protein [Bradyrhizobium lablabi]|uniref:hypothetical protein n=1 Tax=Bradyrhizobium lablabi TaxID=722472 RepID=UPI001BA9518F|nr:hypothetical protein [Bradyrhizobium lablabi]MBR0698211.1 hypothetical protein [Bradyrhizobium lablabi]
MIKRRRFKQTQSLEERLISEARELREQAKLMPAGAQRNDLLRRARYEESAARMIAWLKPRATA